MGLPLFGMRIIPTIISDSYFRQLFSSVLIVSFLYLQITPYTPYEATERKGLQVTSATRTCWSGGKHSLVRELQMAVMRGKKVDW